jgi:fucose 4-O-acetylase-like acetyltransferase
LHDVDRAKGLAILLVVIGHLAREAPPGSEWYDHLKLIIYEFHMPFFMYLSGMVTFYSDAARTAAIGYGTYLRRRATRLLVPFLVFGVFSVLVKHLAEPFIAVDNNIGSLGQGLMALFWKTHLSPAGSVWYIYVLFIYCMAVPPLVWVVRRTEYLLAMAAALYLLPLPEYFYLDKIGHFFIFFSLGGLAIEHRELYERIIDRGTILWLGLFAVLLVIWPPPAHFSLTPTFHQTLIALVSLPALCALVRQRMVNKSSLLSFVGRYSFVIYLFNTLMIGLTKGVMLHFMAWDDAHFPVFALSLFAAGAVGPILLKEWGLKKVKLLDMMTS